MRSRLGFYRFCFVDLGDLFWELFGFFWTKKNSYLFSSCCFCWWFLGLNLGVQDCKNKHLFCVEDIIAKIINFRRNWIVCDSRIIFSWFGMALGPIFMAAFVALETCSKIDRFSGLPRGTPAWFQAMYYIGEGNSVVPGGRIAARRDPWVQAMYISEGNSLVPGGRKTTFIHMDTIHPSSVLRLIKSSRQE